MRPLFCYFKNLKDIIGDYKGNKNKPINLVLKIFFILIYLLEFELKIYPSGTPIGNL